MRRSRAVRGWRRAASLAFLLLAAGAAQAQDADHDGRADPADNCPAVPNPDQLDRGGVASATPDGRGDLCQCGDVNGNGAAQLNDATVVRRALARLGPGLARPALCNATGPADLADADADGVPNDCNLADVVVLRRALLGLPPGVGGACGAVLAPPADALAPGVSLVAPARVTAGQSFALRASASDAVGVTRLALLVDGVAAGESAGGELALESIAPVLVGARIAVLAHADDAAGNRGTAAAEIEVVAAPDATPPSVGLAVPASAAPGQTIAVLASASDDRGVARVRFLFGTTVLGEDGVPPYEAPFGVPADALPGTSVELLAEAFDAEGNVGRASAALAIAAAPDTAPPTGVTLSAPARARPGQALRASATASDAGGVARVEFHVGGAPIAVDTEAPYEADYTVPASQPLGSALEWTARASDFSGNATDSAPVQTAIAAPGAGVVRGEVYDDARSQPLAGARVRVLEAGGAPLVPALELVSDARGRYALELPEGAAYLEVSADGYTGADRLLEVAPGVVSAPLDARLARRAAAVPVEPGAAAVVQSADGSLELALGVGALPQGAAVTLSPLSEQSLPAPLPLGWSPVAAAEIGPERALLALPAALAFDGVPAGVVAARWDRGARVWRRVAVGEDVEIAAFGAYALAAPDAGVLAPAHGEPLPAAAEQALAAGASAELLPSPQVLFLSADARSEVELALEAPVAPPSGTPLSVGFAERYERLDGARLAGEPNEQDFLLYRRAEGVRARFAATPSELFDGAFLREGAIALDARPRGSSVARALLGADGGTATSPGGASVELAAGALPVPTPIGVGDLAADAALAGDARFDVLAGVALDLAGESLAATPVLRVVAASPPDPDDVVLVVRAVRVRDATRYEWVALAERENGALVARPGGLALPLPGADAEGRYFFVALRAPVAFVAGLVTGALSSAGALVETDFLPFVSLADPSDARFSLPAPLGSVELSATDLASGASGSAVTTLDEPGEVVAQDLALAPGAFTVAALDPADLARQVDVDAAIAVAFTRPLHPLSLTADTFRLLDGETPVPGTLSASADGASALFRPAAPLRGLAAYTIELSPELHDVFGNPLAGNQPDGRYTADFETWDTSPPPRPAPGRIALSIPGDGETEVRGSLGTLAPGTLVFVFNATTGLQTAAVAADDGSFAALLGASPSDDVRLVLQSLAGELTVLEPIPFTDPDGSAVLDARGGAFTSPGGVTLGVLPNALVRSDVVRVADLEPGALAGDLPAQVTALRAFRLDVPDSHFDLVTGLEVIEAGDAIAGAADFSTPHRVDATRTSPAQVSSATAFSFVARARLRSGAEHALALASTGSPEACGGETSASREDAAPALRFTAPACIGPSQAVSLRASAVQPRFSLSAPAAPDDEIGDLYLVLRRVETPGRIVFALEETARVRTELGARVVATDARAPFGLRASGDYVLARADAPLAFLEGSVGGDAALVSTDLSSLGAATSGANGAFLLAVPAGQAFSLLTFSALDGSELASAPGAALAEGDTRVAGVIGDPAAPLSFSVSPAEAGTLSPTGELLFSWSEAIDPQTVTPASLFVQDASGRVVAGERVASAGGSTVGFRASAPWRAGEVYSYRVTTELRALTGAALAGDASGTFQGYAPALLASIAGERVRDALPIGARAYLIDGNRLRSLDLASPGSPVEGNALELSPTPNRIGVTPDAATLLLSAGSPADYGVIQPFALANPLAPLPGAPLRISTPSGAIASAGASPLPGAPSAFAILADAIAISTRGLGLQRVALADLEGAPPAAPPLLYPGSRTATYADVASLGDTLASVDSGGLTLHDPVTFEPLGQAAIDGTPQDVALVETGGRRLALVAAGLPGGVQVFDVGAPAAPLRVAKILPGCAVQRVAADAPFERAWLACSGVRIASLDLDGVDGLEPIDRDRDGRDDRVGGEITVRSELANFALDAPRNLGLIAGGADGLGVVQLAPAEVAITGFVRDPLLADVGDVQSILASGRAFAGDRELRLSLEARIPPGHPGLVARRSGPIAFPSGANEQALVPGANLLRLTPLADGTQAPASVEIVVAEAGGGAELARVRATLAPVPVESLVTSFPTQERFEGGGSAIPLEIAGRAADDTWFNLTRLARFEVESPGLGSISDAGEFAASGGGSSSVRYFVGEEIGSFQVASSLPPVLERLELEPSTPLLRAAGETAPLAVRGVYTDGSTRALAAADGLELVSLSPEVASADASTGVTAVAGGVAEIRAAVGAISASVYATVALFVPPDLEAIELDGPPAPIGTDVASAFVAARLLGTGSLDGIAVTARIEGLAGATIASVPASEASGLVPLQIEGLRAPGAGTVVVEVVDPHDGDRLSASLPLAVVARNSDVEPNESLATAIPVSARSGVEGSLGAGDTRDLFRLELSESGTLAIALGSSDPDAIALRLLDASGAEVASGAPLVSMTAAATYFVEVSSAAPIADYALELALNPRAPRIDAIEPSAAAPGSVVSIRGSGFSRAIASNTILFNGVLAEASSASEDRLDVTVPGFATDGPVTVWVAGRASNEHAFSAGRSGPPAALGFVDLDEDFNLYAADPETGVATSRERLLVGARLSVPRARMEQIASGLGASVDGIFPRSGLYVFRFAPVSAVSDLGPLESQLRALPEVEFTQRVTFSAAQGFAISARDSLLARPELHTAYEATNLYAAWETVIDAGLFDDPGALAEVKVGILDTQHLPNERNAQLFSGVLVNESLTEAMFRASYPNTSFLSCEPNQVIDSHGTQVAGVIGARNREGFAGPTGAATGVYAASQIPSLRMTAIDMCALRLERVHEPHDPSTNPFRAGVSGLRVVAALENLPDRFDIVNISLGDLKSEAEIPGAISQWGRLFRLSPKTLFVVAAGNEGLDSRVAFPAAMGNHTGDALNPGLAAVGDRVLTVAGTGQGVSAQVGGRVKPTCVDDADYVCAERLRIRSGVPLDQGDDRRAAFSNFGSAIDVAAPGTAVLVPNARFSGPTSDYVVQGGTSFSAPLVAGVAALLKGIDPSLSAVELHRIVVETSTPIGVVPPPVVPGYPSGTKRLDWGSWSRPVRLDALAAVQRALACKAAPAPSPDPNEPQLACPMGDVPADEIGASRGVPGKRHALWIADTRRGELFHARFPPTFGEQNGSVVRPAPVSLGETCTKPVGLAESPDGSKLYVACGVNNRLLLWNANTRALGNRGTAASAVPIRLDGRSLAIVGNNVRLGMSPTGNFLAIPTNSTATGASEVLILDARRDRILTQVALTNVTGRVTAAIFDARDNLYALTSETPTIGTTQRGSLVRVQRRAGAARDDTSAWSGTPVIVEPLPHDEPRGLELNDASGVPVLYVYYSGDRTVRAATAHNPLTLTTLSDVIGDVLPGHMASVVPGQEAPQTGCGSTQNCTSTKRAFDMAIDPTTGMRGFLLFFWTGNVGVLDPPGGPGGRLGDLVGVTRILGEVAIARSRDFRLALSPAGGEVALEADDRLKPFYFTEEFGQAMDIDQDGSLLAAGFTGKDQGFLRVFFADNLLAGTSAFREGLADPLTRTIDEFVLSPRRLFHRVDWNAPKPLDAPRDLEFMPQISVLAPRAGETVRGAVAVNVVTRDERIGEIRCALTPGVEPGPRFASGGSLTTMQKGLGHSWRAGPGSAQRPICFFADLTTGDYVLEVRGVRGDREAVVRVPFRYER